MRNLNQAWTFCVVRATLEKFGLQADNMKCNVYYVKWKMNTYTYNYASM